MNIGKQIREIRRSKDITQTQLQVPSGLRREYISNIERGKINPTVETVNKLLRPLGYELRIVPKTTPHSIV
jgi:transcriptional regulator with XRE-family HTH domain